MDSTGAGSDSPRSELQTPAENAPTIESRERALVDPNAPTIAGGTGAGAGPPLDVPVTEQTIGRYRLLSKLGQGGMGMVFEAEQDHPRRRVALKIIRGGAFLTDLHVRMFQREVETLARLKHPNIAGIYDAGRTDGGAHYFAMELVHGQNLDVYLKGRAAALDAGEVRFRLRLFTSICNAVNYAHQRGVIHRDLKPSNILVADADASSGSPLPEIKVLDFGLARITGADVEAATAITEIGVIRGTLPYMSPEQARGNPDEIDLRSDVYALGIILYEMLTGSYPYETQKTSIIEAVRIICETPPAPLHRDWSGVRRPDADLQTIVGKALEKEADRRYESAAALAEDIGRYLESRPILARAPSTMYQLRKFARRNRTLVAGAAATVLALIAGIVVSTTFGLREAAQRQAAEQAQKDTEAVAEFQASMLGEIDAQKMGERLAGDLGERLRKSRIEAGASPEGAEATVASFRAAMKDVNTTDAALQVIDTNVLERAIEAAREKFAAQPKVQAQLLYSIGTTYMKLGLYDKAEAPLLRARALNDSAAGPTGATLSAIRSLADLYTAQGRTAEAEPLFVAALKGHEQTRGPREPEYYGTMNGLALLYGDTGRYASAESLFAIALDGHRRLRGEEDRFTLDIMANYAWVLTDDGKFAAAESLGTRTLALRRKVLGNDDAQTMGSVNNLAVLYRKMERNDAAEPLLREDYETSRRLLGEEHPDVLVSMTNLGRFYIASGKFSEAATLLARALATSKKVMPPGFFGTGVTAMAYGDALAGLGRHREAVASLVEAHAILLPLKGEHDRGVQRCRAMIVVACEKSGQLELAAKWRAKLDPPS